MKAQLPTELAKYVGIFFEGLIEIVFVTILIALAVAFVNVFIQLNLGSQSTEIIIEYVAFAFIASLIINFIKGMIVPTESVVSIVGMIVGIIVFGAAVTPIAPQAIGGMISYIVAAIIGIILGIWLRTSQQRAGGAY